MSNLTLEQLSEEEQQALLVQRGVLDWMLLPHQYPVYQQFRQWNDHTRHDPEKLESWAAQDVMFDNMFVTEWARRNGKSSFWLIILIEEAIRYYNRTGKGYEGLLGTAYKEHINDIFVPLIDELFGNIGTYEGYKPVYKGTTKGKHEGLHIPAVNGYIKLVGLDVNPDATRGRFTDGAAITEASYVRDKQLVRSVQTVLGPQMLGRKHGFIALESSSPETLEHPFNKYRDDSIKRGAYSMLTIDANPLISQKEKEREIRRMGGINSPQVRREFYCEVAIEREAAIIPEFNEKLHVVDSYPTPPYAFAVTGMDPGFRDMCGLIWFYVDFMGMLDGEPRVVVQASWGERNAGSDKIAKVIRSTEHKLWGTNASLSYSTPKPLTVKDIMKPPSRSQHTTVELEKLSIDTAEPTGLGSVWNAPEGSLTWFDDDKLTLRPNPSVRVSDHKPELLDHLEKQYGLKFTLARKGKDSKLANLRHLRMMFANNQIVIIRSRETEMLIRALRSGEWNDKRTEFKDNPLFGHWDVGSALTYAVQEVDFLRNPNLPRHLDPHAQNTYIRPDIREHLLKPEKALIPSRQTRVPRGKYR